MSMAESRERSTSYDTGLEQTEWAYKVATDVLIWMDDLENIVKSSHLLRSMLHSSQPVKKVTASQAEEGVIGVNDAGASPYLALRRARGERDAAIAECPPLAASQAEDMQTKESDIPTFLINGEGTFPPLPLKGQD